MALTTATLIDTFLQTGISPNDLLIHFEAILLLRKKYGKQIYTSRIIENIQQADPTTYAIIQILVHYNKHTILNLKYLISYIRKNIKNYIPNFTITAPTKYTTETITKHINKQFPNNSINTQDTIDIGISIAGEWRHYKRNLNQDIQKLLG